MNPKATFTDAEAIFVLSPLEMIDRAYEQAYGKKVEERIRKLPHALIYLQAKYKIAPKWLLIEFVGTICDVGETVATELTDEAEGLGLFTVTVPNGDPRQRLYFFTEEQKRKVLEVQRCTVGAYATAMGQMKTPDQPEAGKTAQNERWYANIMDMINRHDSEWERVMKRIRKITHLSAVAAFLLGTALCALATSPVIAATWSAGTVIK